MWRATGMVQYCRQVNRLSDVGTISIKKTHDRDASHGLEALNLESGALYIVILAQNIFRM